MDVPMLLVTLVLVTIMTYTLPPLIGDLFSRLTSRLRPPKLPKTQYELDALRERQWNEELNRGDG